MYALSFRYGQRHEAELACAREQAADRGVAAHEIVDLTHLGRLVAPASSLIAASPLVVPIAAGGAGVPTTYVPARNTLFLAYALAWAEALGAGEIWLGVNALDYSGYPDCRPEFIAAFERVIREGTRGGVRVRTPLLFLRKSEIVGLALRHGVDLTETLSCYSPRDGSRPCGMCDSCRIRAEGFTAAGVLDPSLPSRPPALDLEGIAGLEALTC